MKNKILVVEYSKTFAQLFNDALKNSCEVFIEESGINAILKLSDLNPKCIFVNTDLPDMDALQFEKIISKINGAEKIKIIKYATLPSPFFDNIPVVDEKNIGPFVQISLSTLSQLDETENQISNPDIRTLLETQTNLWKSGCNETFIYEKIFSLIKYGADISNISKKFLNLCTRLCSSPLAALRVSEIKNNTSYYICSEKISSQQKEDFLNATKQDFEKTAFKESHIFLDDEEVTSSYQMDMLFPDELSLGFLEKREIKFSDNQIHSIIFLAKTRDLNSNQTELLNYAVNLFSMVLENALILKRRIFLESGIRRAFSRFVPEEIIDDLAKKDVQQKIAVGEKREIAILFSDIRSFTNISEKNRPEVLVAFLNRYFTVMVDIIKKYGGTIDKFIGDAIMAEFGTPISYEDNARRAAKAAYEMRRALPTVPQEDLVMPDGMIFDIGIGIHYGDAIVGSIGSKDKTDYSVIGDSVNLASRLEGLTKTYGVQLIVSESMKNDILRTKNPDDFVFRYLDDVRVKGKKKAVPIYAIDRSLDEFPPEYRDAYTKGMELYKDGIFRLAKDYFEKALEAVSTDKAAKLMLSRCKDFIENPPENWDGAISFTTK